MEDEVSMEYEAVEVIELFKIPEVVPEQVGENLWQIGVPVGDCAPTKPGPLWRATVTAGRIIAQGGQPIVALISIIWPKKHPEDEGAGGG